MRTWGLTTDKYTWETAAVVLEMESAWGTWQADEDEALQRRF